MYSTRLFILYRLGSHNILILYIYFISYIDFIHISNRRFWESDIHVTYIYILLWVIVWLAKLFFFPKISSDLPCRPVIDNTIATTTPYLLPAWQSSSKTPPHLPLTHSHARTPVHPPSRVRSNDVSTCSRTQLPCETNR